MSIKNALSVAEAVLQNHVNACHDREKHFRDANLHSRPPDWAEIAANTYAAAAEALPLIRQAQQAIRITEEQLDQLNLQITQHLGGHKR